MDNNFLNQSFFERFLKYLQNAVIYTKLKNPANCTVSSLSPSKSALVCSILSQSIDELLITNKGKKNFYLMDQYVQMKDRYRQVYRDKLFDEITLEPMHRALERMSSVKLEKDIEMIRKHLLDTHIELSEGNTFSHLWQIIEQHNQEAFDQYKLIADYCKNNLLIKQFSDQMVADKSYGKKLLKQLNDDIMDLESQIHDCLIQTGIKNRLVRKWEETRHEQAAKILQDEEIHLKTTTTDYKVKSEQEQIAINEIENFLQYKIGNIEKMILFWNEKYDGDIREYNCDINETKLAIAEVQLKNDDINCRYDVRQLEIDNYREEQRILAEKRAFEQKQWNAAVRIQSWWRGVMVRKQLGPYRPKKKGKKGKGSGKKK